MKKTFLVMMLLFSIQWIIASELPGNTALPSSKDELTLLSNSDMGNYKYSVEDYFQRPRQSTFKFSPDGKYISYREKDENGKRHIFVKDTESGKINRAIEEKDELIRTYAWANNTRLLYLMDQGGNENYHIYAGNLDGSDQADLTPFEGVRASILSELEDQPDYMIVSMNLENPQIFAPYRLNIITGELEKIFSNDDPTRPVMGYDFDKDGKLRAITRQEDLTNYVLYYRTSEEEAFEQIIKTTWKNDFYIIAFDYETEYPHDAYVISNVNSDTKEIILYDLDKKKTIKTVFKNKHYDVGGMSTSKKRGYEIDYFYYTGEKTTLVPQSSTYRKIYRQLKKEFGNKTFLETSKTDNEDKYLIFVDSDKLYGKYYLYDAESRKITYMMNIMPQLKEKDMASMRPVKFKSRDGLTIHGYITVPNSVKNGVKVPLIVNPHGGPYGIRDQWRFNPETQLFASRGYATLQVNYRGSGGYGKEFYMAGNKQIGRNMLNDLEDGVAFAKNLGFIDKEKIAIYGASYGGLATLGSLVKTPELYTCGVDYVGVSNLFTFTKSFPEYWKPLMGQFYEQWYDETSPEEKEIMKQVSPALNVKKINKPLFVIQGANDPRVNINESDQIVINLRDRGFDIPYMVKYNEGHGFGHEENRIELYNYMMGFFARHLK